MKSLMNGARLGDPPLPGISRFLLRRCSWKKKRLMLLSEQKSASGNAKYYPLGLRRARSAINTSGFCGPFGPYRFPFIELLISDARSVATLSPWLRYR
jgi:hypothetical protein